MLTKVKLITILGATASGKTSVAAHLAASINGEVLSGDSRQVYRNMSIGTGKDLGDYVVNGAAIPYHLIDIADAGSQYTLYDYCCDFRSAYADVVLRGRQPILCGGSGLYIEAAVRGYSLPKVSADAALRASLEEYSTTELQQKLVELRGENSIADPQNRRRLVRAIEIAMQPTTECGTRFSELPNLYFCIVYDRETRRQRIAERLRQRLENGLVEEVESLIARGVSPQMLCSYGLEYKFVTMYLMHQLSYDKMEELLLVAIQQYAKRQMTWLRGMERRGAVLHTISGDLPLSAKVETIRSVFLKEC